MAVVFSSLLNGGSPVRPCRTSPKCIVLTLAIAFIALNWVLLHTARPSMTTGTPDELESDQDSYRPSGLFGKTHFQQTLPDTEEPSASSSSFSWFADWIRWRAIDPALDRDQLVSPDKRSFDVVFSWVNGSDPSLRTLRNHTQSHSPLFANADPKLVAQVTTKRFRDLDELRYSMRSALEYGAEAVRNIYLMVSPLPESPTADPTTFLTSGLSQAPAWFDPSAEQPKPLELVSHTEFFEHKEHLPTFNSLAIEVNMHHLPGLASNFLYLNDDVFIGRRLDLGDVWTPLFGYVLHLEVSLEVPPTLVKNTPNPFNIGEWHALQFSNVILSEHFGQRYRAYIAHIVHVFNKEILDEIQAMFPAETLQTSSHHFRGEGEAKDIHTSFIFCHYLLERLRQVQLEAFWNHSVDFNMDGQLEWRERQWLIDRIHEWNDGDQATFHMGRDHLENHKQILEQYGMPLTGSTDYRTSGMDGFPFMINNANTSKSILTPGIPHRPYVHYEPHARRQCRLDVDFCLGSAFANTSIPVLAESESKAVFDRLFRQEFHCGDCLLEMALHHRDLGMRALFPADESSPQYQQLVKDLEKYQYVLGTSPYVFMALQGPETANKSLTNIMNRRDSLTFFCINDDFPDNPQTEQAIQHTLQSFMTKRYPTAAPWEKYPPVEILAP